MKTFSLLVLLTFFSVQLLAQSLIPNAGFENWMNGVPDSWFYAPDLHPAIITVSQSNTAHSGSSALRLDVVSLYGATIVTSLVTSGTGASAQGFPYSQRPASFTGYYQFSPAAQSGDTLTITATLIKTDINGTPIAAGAIGIGASASSYVQFTVPLMYYQADNPAVCVITFLIRGPMNGAQTTPHLGSYALIDDIEFAGSTGVLNDKPGQPLKFSLDQNYPNPFNPSTTISFSLGKNGYTTLKVYDLLGREVATLVNEQKSAGNYTVPWNAIDMVSGVYFYKLNSGTYSQTKKLIIAK